MVSVNARYTDMQVRYLGIIRNTKRSIHQWSNFEGANTQKNIKKTAYVNIEICILCYKEGKN